MLRAVRKRRLLDQARLQRVVRQGLPADQGQADLRRRFLNDLAKLNEQKLAETGDPEINTRIAQYEMAYKMQTSVPELTDISDEPAHTFELYGEDAKKPGTYAFNCLLARRLCERDVRFVQLFHRGWDQHLQLPKQIGVQCKDTDRASAGLVTTIGVRVRTSSATCS